MNNTMSSDAPMSVIKRNGSSEPVQFDKVLQRIQKAAAGLSVNYTRLAQLVLAEIHDGVRTTDLDELAARIAISYMSTNPDWGTLAAQIIISNCQRSSPPLFSTAMEELATLTDAHGRPAPALAPDVAAFIRENRDALNALIVPANDFLLDYFGFKTLERSYLMRGIAGKTVETPQYMWLRVAVGMWSGSAGTPMERIAETYRYMSTKAFTHATPTLFNAGTPRPQLSSCFVAGTPVHTMKGVKPIESVELGDEVVTHTGTVRKVVQLHTNPIGDRQLYDIKVAGSPTITVTENHRLMSLSDEQEKWGETPSWNRVDYLRIGDWVAIPNKKGGSTFTLDILPLMENVTGDGNKIAYSYDVDDNMIYPYYTYTLNKKNAGNVVCMKKAVPFKRYWVFDEKCMELMGIWYGDGSITNAKNSAGHTTPRNINIVAYHTNTALIEFVPIAFKEMTGIEHVTVSSDSYGMVSMGINHSILAQLWKNIFKCGFKEKRIPSFFNQLGYEQIRAFIAGLTSSDGCVSSIGSVTVQLSNPPFMEDIYHLARSVGMPVTLTIMHGRLNGNPTGRMTIPFSIIKDSVKKFYTDDRLARTGRNNWQLVRIIDGVTFMRINGKTRSEKTAEFVYTLGVEEDHSYSVGGIIAENCFLVSMKEDSVEGIFDTLKQCAQISKYAGGIGLHIHNIRAAGSHIAGTNGTSDGIMPMLRVFNNTARYINQGGRRNGSFAVYLEPWHADIQAFLKMKSNTGSEEERARDLFYALWIPDLFMRRVEAGADWSLFCPHEAPGLADAYGPDFDALYERYEAAGLARRSIPAQKIWSDILVSQIETGTPYLLYKDAANLKSNQKNLGTIKSSNLCVTPETRITIYEPDTPPRQVNICDVVDQEVCVWNGEQIAMVVPRKTATNQPILCVSVLQRTHSDSDSDSSSGKYKYLNCTPEHLFIMQSMASFNESPRRAAKDLRPGDRLRSWRDANGVYIYQEVVAVHALTFRSDTYCYTEEENHVGIFNGILTGQCTEIMEYSSPEETAVCNLASIALPYFLGSDSSSSHFNFEKLRTVVAVVVRNLNRVIDINYYPTPETRRSNLRHRPVGIGIQGLADLFALLGIAWESPAAATLNRAIFENIYFAALEQSATEAEAVGPYETYAGSPLSAGILQPDLWGLSPDSYATAATLDWAGLRARLQRTGVRNSLLVAPMPTASTSQILGYNECIEPFTSNLYVRRTLAGEFTVVNRYLVSALQGLGLWSPELKERIVAANGSVQGIPEIPDAVKALYKTVWEIKQKTLIDMAADRGTFICQSQSLNLFVSDPTIAKLSSMHFYAWKRGLKTGIYYLRTKSAVQAIKFTVDPALMKGGAATDTKEAAECLLCSS